ncbi:MAG: Trk system potassium transporter TrkA [Oscillospiraceae bacterium]|jgi:trk system potassium uptake protein TrkA|nr:Trk system potassium transporter TrkA [Oscillospiraceae bacterium]
MKIVVVGGGTLGSAIIDALSKERHDISLIESDASAAEKLDARYDILTVCGNGVSKSDQEEAGVPGADLLITSSDSDELNMLCCLMARKVGAKHTIARVRDPEYASELDFLSEELGLSMWVNPEQSAAAEIARVMLSGGALQMETFAGGNAQLVEILLTNDMSADGIKLRDFPRIFSARVLICAVKRGNDVFIPDGEFELCQGDRLSITAAPEELDKLYKSLRIAHHRVKDVMIIGGGRIAFYLIPLLSDAKIAITVVEQDLARCRELAETFPNINVLHADATEQDYLKSIGIGKYDAVAALTGDDEDNLVIAMYAVAEGVSRTTVKITRDTLLPIAERVFDGTIISPKRAAADKIVHYIRGLAGSPGGSIEALYHIVGGMAEALEFHARAESEAVGTPLRDMPIKKGVLIAGIIRADGRGKVSAIIPGGNDIIQAGDRVIVVTASKKLSGLDDILDA